MSKYGAFGKLDDRFVTEGDTFFTRMNARIRPNQLKPGEVTLSKNGRMNEDGTWQTRKGLSTLFGAITSGTDSVRLPWVVLGAQRQSNVVTVTLDATPSLSFIVGENITVKNLGFSSDDPNGTVALASVDFTNKTITYADTGANEVFTIASHTTGATSVVYIGSSRSTELNFTLADDEVNEIYGSAIFSDPNSQSDDYAFIATNALAIIVRLKDQALYKVRYESGGESVDGPVGMTQGFDKMYIFRDTKTTLAATPSLNTHVISSASQSGQTITVNTSTAHGRTAGDYITLTGLGNWQYNPNDVYQIESSPSPTSTQFTVKMADSQTKTFNVSGARAEYFADFSRVAKGAYTAPVYLTDTTATASDGVVTMDVTSHNLEIGNQLTIQAGASPFDAKVGTKVIVASVPNANQFTFNLDVADATASCTASKPLALGKGFIHQPAAPFGVVHQRRLWLPYQYTSDVAPSDRGVRDEIVASDIMDPDTYDVIGNQFRPSAGQSDYLVGLQPFTEDTLVVFNRKSIHLMTGVSGSLADVKTNLVTTEVGASARKSIAQVANQLLFLSDQGIYAVEFLDEYNLRGVGTPLSESIQPYIDRINQTYAHLSTGVYFDNRYWLAVPLDSSVGAGDALKLNTIIVYNFQNKGFESIDTVNSSSFTIRDLLVGREGAENALYLTTEEGGMHKVDGNEGGDVVSITAGQASSTTIPVVSQIRTRQYDADQMDRKMFARAELHLKSGNATVTDGSLSFITEDPDSTTSAVSVSTALGSSLAVDEDSSIRVGIRKRGFGVQADFTPTSGRPFVRALSVDARVTDRSRTSIK